MSSKLHLLGRRIHGVGKHVRIFRNFPFTIAVNLGAGPKTGEHELRLRNGLHYTLDAAYLISTSNAIKDVVADDVYGLARLDPTKAATIIDIGAHVGAFCLNAALHCPAATVYAYEPSAQSFPYLCHNIQANGLAGQVVACQQAVAGRDGQVDLFASRQSATRHSLYENDFLDTRDGEKAKVDAVSLTTLFNQLNIASCDFLKMDCEGAEYEILFAAPEDVIRRIQRVGMEYHEGMTENTGEDLERFFADLGFVVRRAPVFEDNRIGMLLAERTPGS